MNKFTKYLLVLFAIVLLLQVAPAVADGPDHRPEPWEVTPTVTPPDHRPEPWEITETAPPSHPRLPRVTATATQDPYPAPTDPYPAPYPAPYPEPAATNRLWEWLRSLIWLPE